MCMRSCSDGSRRALRRIRPGLFARSSCEQRSCCALGRVYGVGRHICAPGGPPHAPEGQHCRTASHDWPTVRHIGSAHTIPPGPPRCMQTKVPQQAFAPGRPQGSPPAAQAMGAQRLPSTPGPQRRPGQQRGPLSKQLSPAMTQALASALGTSGAETTSVLVGTSVPFCVSIPTTPRSPIVCTSLPFGTSWTLPSAWLLPESVSTGAPVHAAMLSAQTKSAESERIFMVELFVGENIEKRPVAAGRCVSSEFAGCVPYPRLGASVHVLCNETLDFAFLIFSGVAFSTLSSSS